jgi:flavin-dependent dehydrogenase
MSFSPPTFDVLVVGARCGGAATAMLLARLGHDVALLDRAQLPSNTVSTSALARGGLVQLRRWGLLGAVLEAGAPPIRRVSFTSPVGSTTRTVKHTAGVEHLLAPRRDLLDGVLLDAAVRAGARLRTVTAMTGLLRDDTGRVTGVRTRTRAGAEQTLSARLVIGADGVRSRVARAVGAVAPNEPTSGGGTFYASFAGLPADTFEFRVSDRALAGVFPCAPDEACVWISTPAGDSAALRSAGPDKATALVELIEAGAPELARRLRRCRPVSGVRGAMNLPNVIRRPFGPGWALVGDAGYHRDPITGHGMTDAFRDAELLARAANGWLRGGASEGEAMQAYAEQRDRAIRPIFDLTCALAAFPGVDRFVELQKQLSDALEHEARWLADLPALAPTRVAA